MRWEKLRIRNLGPFKDAQVDLTQVPGTIVKIGGRNGAGKTTLLELLPGALFRECPTRGTLASLATARDASVEVTVCNGQRYTVRQSVDAISGKGEALIARDGVPQVESGKVRDADKWVAEHFPPPEVLYNSSVSPQGRRGLLDMTSGERKAVLLRALRIEHLEHRAEQARERARAAKATLDTLRARADDLPWPALAVLKEQLFEARARVDSAAEGARVARAGLERARAASQDAARAAELAEQRRAAEGRLASARAQLADLEKRIGNNRALLARADEVNAAVTRAAELDAQIAAEQAAFAEASAAHRAAQQAEKHAQAAYESAKREVQRLHEELERVGKRRADKEAVLKAVDLLEGFRNRMADREAGIASDETRAAELERLVLQAKDWRIAGLRQCVTAIASEHATATDFSDWASDALAQDDERAAKAEQAPGELTGIREHLKEGRKRLTELRNDISRCEQLAARKGEIERAEADADRIGAALLEAQQTKSRTGLEYDEARARADAACKAEHALKSTGTQVERAKLDDLLKLAPVLAQASARIEELEAQLPAVRASIAAAETELTGLPVVNVERVDVAGQESAVARAEAAEHQAREAAARALSALERGQEVAAKRAAVEQEVKAAEVEHADWVRLGQDLGKDGLQALEIDAAIPELNELANHLLRTCHGSRFTVEMRAEKLSADGKRSLEGLELRVIDTERGRDALAETYSGGECVIVGEALSLALTMVACRRAGIEEPTLLRDESGAALDEDNGRAYSAMLRLAAQQIGASKVLVVCHGSWLHADAEIRVEDGRLEVVS